MIRTILTVVVGSLFSALWANADPIDVGAKAPVASAVDQNGQTVDLGQLYQGGLVLVYFYPKADTPGCTAEACSLRDAYEALTTKGIKVVGVSVDDVGSQKAFAEKYKLPFTLLADPGHKIINGFGVPLRVGHASRQSFLIKDGVVVWRDLKASTKQQADDVLAAVAALNAKGETKS